MIEGTHIFIALRTIIPSAIVVLLLVMLLLIRYDMIANEEIGVESG